jgi:phosphoesterase RecJ-like protein
MRIDVAACARRLAGAEDILLICHRDPDPDTYGSAMALYDTLGRMGKRARVVCPTPPPENLSFLSRPMEDFEPKFVVTVDVASRTMLGDGEKRRQHVDLSIDHHPTNPLYADETLLVPCAATGELVYEVILKLGAELTPFAATALYAAIAGDTGGFRYGNTTAQTLRYAAALMDAGADAALVRRRLFESKSHGRIAVEADALGKIRFYEEGRIAVISVSLEIMEKTKTDESELELLASAPIQIDGVDIGITLKERDDGSVRISVRTTENADAAAICSKFHGGGHLRAAGCRIFTTLADSEVRMVQAAAEQLHGRQEAI